MGEETEQPNKVGVMATIPKKHRSRKKLLYKALKKQMEFYFSDVNITKDRFMSELLEQSPCVDLSIFLNFNKIKSMTSKVKDIANALQSSDLLEVTKDGTKVFRVDPPQIKENSDDCTIYVEQIPTDADHSWLIDIFQAYGLVDYVSIPKFKHSRKNKGFAFVEFKDAESAKNALTAFSEIGCSLSLQMDPGELCSIRTFDERETTEGKNIVKVPKEEIEDNVPYDFGEHEKQNTSSDENVEHNQRKKVDSIESSNNGHIIDNKNGSYPVIKKENDDCFDYQNNSCNEGSEESVNRKRKYYDVTDDNFDTKKVKAEIVDENDEMSFKKPIQTFSATDDINRLMYESNSHEIDTLKNEQKITGLNIHDYEVHEAIDSDTDDRQKKTRRKRKKHKKSKVPSLITYGLQILSKKEWKALRNKYLNEQRKKMRELKQYIWHRNHADNISDFHYSNTNNMNSKLNTEDNFTKTEKVLIDNTSSGEVKLSNRLTLTPGLIVKVTLPQPVISRNTFKNEAKIFPKIKYTDVREGSNIVYLRFESKEDAEEFVKTGHWKKSEIIKNDEEKSYWDKIAIEREEKLTKGRTIKRGRDKLLKKADELHVKHIWFN